MDLPHTHSRRAGKNLDHLCTVAVCGLFGLTAIMAYQSGMLQRLNLIPYFHKPVLAAGVALLLMVALQTIVILRRAPSWNTEKASEAKSVEENGDRHQPHSGTVEVLGVDHSGGFLFL